MTARDAAPAFRLIGRCHIDLATAAGAGCRPDA